MGLAKQEDPILQHARGRDERQLCGDFVYVWRQYVVLPFHNGSD